MRTTSGRPFAGLAAIVLVACSTFSSPSPAASSDCGPLTGASCQDAIEIAVKSLPQDHPAVVSTKITSPSASHSCPPSGGPMPDMHICQVIAVVVTVNGQIDVGLIQNGDHWMSAATIE